MSPVLQSCVVRYVRFISQMFNILCVSPLLAECRFQKNISETNLFPLQSNQQPPAGVSRMQLKADKNSQVLTARI